MGIMGFHFRKILVEKKQSKPGKLHIDNTLVIDGVKEAKVAVGASKSTGLECSFTFTPKYQPEIAVMEIKCALVYVDTEAKVKEAQATWEKDNKLPTDVMVELYQYVLDKCNIQALLLGRDMNLPPHIALTKISAK